MMNETTDNRTVEGTHVRVYDGRKYVSSVDLPYVEPKRVLCGLIDIRNAQECYESNWGLNAEIPTGYSYRGAPEMIEHCIESLTKVKQSRYNEVVSDGLNFGELMGALVAAQRFIQARD